jgi:uncharacterized protein (TIGR00369 family)
MKIIETPRSHEHCLLCGDNNAQGLNLRFRKNTSGEIHTAFQTSPVHQGYKNILHGGMIASVLDSTMCYVLFERGIEAVTMEMKTRYHTEVPAHADVTAQGFFVKNTGPFYTVAARLYYSNTLAASSRATFARRGYPFQKGAAHE